jgi:hypothetical protein
MKRRCEQYRCGTNPGFTFIAILQTTSARFVSVTLQAGSNMMAGYHRHLCDEEVHVRTTVQRFGTAAPPESSCNRYSQTQIIVESLAK